MNTKQRKEWKEYFDRRTKGIN